MQKKKTFRVGFLMLLVIAMLAGCSSGGTNKGKETEKQQGDGL